MDKNKTNYVYIKPQKELFKYAAEIDTPAIIYDFNQLENIASSIKNDLKTLDDAKLNFAVKACHNIKVLQIYSNLGFGCDVASIEEYKIAKKAGFSNITTTAPAYNVYDMTYFVKNGIIMDLDSVDQIELFGSLFPNEQIGLRLRIGMPSEYENAGSFGGNSRFGVDIVNEKVYESIKKNNLKVKRLHVHTGQMSIDALFYKMKYLLTIAEYFKDIDTIDLGGGFFHLYINRNLLQLKLIEINEYVNNWKALNGRNITIIFEPGGALVTPGGYLITQVMSIQHHDIYKTRIVTVDSSAWNLAPWHKPNVTIVNCDKRDCNKVSTIIAGNTLYELDFFGTDIQKGYIEYELISDLHYGDRLILSSSGGYTLTNYRRFNGLEPPKEYRLQNGSLEQI